MLGLFEAGDLCGGEVIGKVQLFRPVSPNEFQRLRSLCRVHQLSLLRLPIIHLLYTCSLNNSRIKTWRPEVKIHLLCFFMYWIRRDRSGLDCVTWKAVVSQKRPV
jgi:hypothetical protein